MTASIFPGATLVENPFASASGPDSTRIDSSAFQSALAAASRATARNSPGRLAQGSPGITQIRLMALKGKPIILVESTLPQRPMGLPQAYRVIVDADPGQDYRLDVNVPRMNGMGAQFEEMVGAKGAFRICREAEIYAIVEDAPEAQAAE